MLNESELQVLLTDLKQKMQDTGVSVYRILYDLKVKNITPVTATRIVFELTEKSLAESKRYVAQHPAWEKEYYDSKAATKELTKTIDELIA